MKTKIIRIGNSQGVRIPKTLLQQTGLEGEVLLRAHNGSIIIEKAIRPRAGWAKAARQMAAAGEDVLLDEPTPTIFDETEWEW